MTKILKVTINKTLASLFPKKKKRIRRKNEQKQKDTNGALMHMIARTLSPVSLAEKPYFKRLIDILCPRYETYLGNNSQLNT